MMPTLRRPGVLPYLMPAPAHILLALFIFLPAVYVFALSFMQSSYGQGATFVGLENYTKLLRDRYFWVSAWNTFIVVNAVVYIELALALALTLVLPPPGALCRVIVSIILLPYAVSEVVGVLMIKYMFDPGAGVVAYWLQALGLPELEWTTQPGHALVLVVLLSVWLHTPFTFLIVYTARLGLPAELYEAARTDGADAWQRFCHVTLPLLMPAILVAVVFRYIFAFRIFPEVWLLTQGGPAARRKSLRSTSTRAPLDITTTAWRLRQASAMVVLSLLIAAAYLRSMYRRMFVHAR